MNEAAAAVARSVGDPEPASAGLGGRVDPDAKVPLYHQIFVILRNQIFSGQVERGALLPGEQEIAAEFAVSRITAKRALDELAVAGLVVRERGRGTRVVQSPPPPSVTTSVEGWLDNISLMGLATEARVLEFGYLPAGTEVAAALELAPRTSVQRSVRVRTLDGETLSYLVTHVPEAIGRAFDQDDMNRLPLLTLLERAGVRISSARQLVTATVADTAVAAALGIHVGAPLLEVRRVVFDQQEVPVEYIKVLYRPERYQFEMNLKRVASEAGMSWSAETGSPVGT